MPTSRRAVGEGIPDDMDDTVERDLGLAPAVGDDWWSDHTRVVPRPALSVVPSVAPEAPAEPARRLVRPEPPEPPEPPRMVERPVELPVPGRHASRRPLDRSPTLVPDALRGRVGLGSSQVTAIAVLGGPWAGRHLLVGRPR